MSHLSPVPFTGGGLPSRIERQASKEIAVAMARGAVSAARETAKIEALEAVTETALLAASHLSSLEGLLVARTPHAEARLRHIADAGVAGIADVVLRAGRSFR